MQSSPSRIAREDPEDPALVQENLVQLTNRTGHGFFGTFRVVRLGSVRGLRILRLLRFLLLWLAKDYCLIIPGKALTLSLLLRLNHPLLQSLKLNRHSLKTEILQDLILIPDQLTSQLSPPDPLRIRSILRLCILVRSLNQILNRLDHDLPLRLTPSIDTLPNLRPLTNLILAHYNPHSPTS